jgi:hypothetical protein
MVLQTAQGQNEDSSSARDCFELREYTFDRDGQQQTFEKFLGDAAIPALNRLGIQPVGMFHKPGDQGITFVVIRHPSIDSVARLTSRLMNDAEFLAKGAAILETPAKQAAYERLTNSLLLAFTGMPQLETPVTNADRVIQLRIYESHSVLAGQKKIEMFNDAGEIRIFREAGLHPVFFGEAIAGPRMPNLTYMLAFESQEELDTNWQTFINHPDWKRISALPEYANERILSNITNHVLRPADCSQI